MVGKGNPAAGKYPIAAAALGLLLAGAFIPSPLYELYRREWGLSPAAVSGVFAIYASSVIPSLLFLGGISDQIGRRKALLMAIAIAALGSLVLAFASNLWALLTGRILQGVALGMGVSTASAAVREWMDEAMRPRAGTVTLLGTAVGSAFGATVGGALAQYAPFPTTLPYLLHIVLLGGIAAAVATVPSCPHLGMAAHRSLPTIPRAIRWPFYLASVESLIGWATFAVFVSLLPSFLIRTLNAHNLLVGTFIVIALQIGQVTASLLGRSMRDRDTIATAMLALGAGTWLLLIAVPYHQIAFIALATLIVGVGGGLSYLAGLNIVNSIASPDHRAELLSAFLVACHLGLSVPTLGVGIAANFVGLYNSIIGAAVLLGIIAIVTMLLMIEHKPGSIELSLFGQDDLSRGC